MKKEYVISIRAPIERVFDMVDDQNNIKKWMGGQLLTEYHTSFYKENPVGTKFKHKIEGLIEVEGEVIAYHKPLLLGVGERYKSLSGTIFYHFKFIDDGKTEITCDFEVLEGTRTQKILVKTMFPLFDSLMQKHLDSLKTMAENGLK